MSEAPIADQLAIRELVARYADAVTRRHERDWAATWAEDGEWHVFGNPTKGREAIVILWNELMGGLPFVVQLPGAGTISIDGSNATGRWYITEHGQTAEGGGLLTIGVYHDRYRRLDGGWRFARRRFDILYSGPPDLSGMTLPFPENP